MSSTTFEKIKFSLFGESHGSHIGFVLDNIPSGIKIDEKLIAHLLQKRRPRGNAETKRLENDEYEFLSGVFNGYTTGDAVCCIIKNQNTRSSDYEALKNTPRPSHADYTSFIKSNGFCDYRGGGHFSGRLTAAIVLAYGVIYPYLKEKGIMVETHILKMPGIEDFDFLKGVTKENLELLFEKDYPTVFDLEEAITKLILDASKNNDSIGGIIQTAIYGLKPGVGSCWFGSLEGAIAKSVFAIGGVKGIEFGKGFALLNETASSSNDEFVYEDGVVKTKTNNSGGINGGITNGMPVVFNCAIKPTPSIAKMQNTINLETLENVKIKIQGRHDPAIIRRICIVVSAITALTILDEIL